MPECALSGRTARIELELTFVYFASDFTELDRLRGTKLPLTHANVNTKRVLKRAQLDTSF